MNKPFSEFRKTLTSDDISRMVEKTQVTLDNSREELSGNLETDFGNQIVITAMTLSIELLEKYHNWLKE